MLPLILAADAINARVHNQPPAALQNAHVHVRSKVTQNLVGGELEEELKLGSALLCKARPRGLVQAVYLATVHPS